MGKILINELDNVCVLKNPQGPIPAGHKIARRDIKSGEDIIKYGNPIGVAIKAIKKGEHVHTHNCKTKLSDVINYKYEPVNPKVEFDKSPYELTGYKRSNGKIGIRNELWVVVTVGCMNPVAKRIADEFKKIYPQTYAITHPYGCSQIGQDFDNTKQVLRQIISHPNAGGVLVLALGCENIQIENFKDLENDRIKCLVSQDVEGEISEGLKILEGLYKNLKNDKREPIDISDITIGLKCGGSDGLSGITANPLLGRLSDKLATYNTKIIMSEVPEMFGAEHLLMNRCKDEATFNKCVDMINHFKNYFKQSGMPIYENPSPGNKAGGITTLEDKSLGCIQKCGSSPINDVLAYAESAHEPGVNLLYGPGNDLVSTTNLAASGANLILFTTGRGTPFSTFVPCVKVATNTKLANKKSAWIDYDAQANPDENELIKFVVDVVNGKVTSSESLDDREISIFKTGVIL